MSSTIATTVAEAVGATIAAQGVRDAFGVIGSGNLVATNALAAGGARFHAARHEGGAICMADGYARVSGQVGVCSVHQGPGLTNAMTGLAEAAKSRSPVLVLAGEAPAAALTSNFRIDQPNLVAAVGAVAERVHGPDTAVADARRAYTRARDERRPVVLMLPIDLQTQPVPNPHNDDRPPRRSPATTIRPTDATISQLAGLIQNARRPAIIAGRGAVLADAGQPLAKIAELTGALLATSAAANGLFAGHPQAIGISGGFASPEAAAALAAADLVLAVGASLNYWTTRHGALIHPAACVVQLDVEAGAIGRHRPVDVAVHADAGETARLLADALAQPADALAQPANALAQPADALAQPTPAPRPPRPVRGWADEPYSDESTAAGIDPRTFSLELERRLGPDKAVAVDSGAFMGYPSMFLTVPDARAWVFVNGFQSVGLGLGNAIGAAVARPDRLTVAAIGDGGAFMALAEIETAVRLKLNLLVAIYDDRAYGAEVHHFAPLGHDVSGVQFPDADLAAIARSMGARAQTVTEPDDLQIVTEWINTGQPDPGPLVLDAKVNPAICAEWLAEAFKSG